MNWVFHHSIFVWTWCQEYFVNISSAPWLLHQDHKVHLPSSGLVKSKRETDTDSTDPNLSHVLSSILEESDWCDRFVMLSAGSERIWSIQLEAGGYASRQDATNVVPGTGYCSAARVNWWRWSCAWMMTIMLMLMTMTMTMAKWNIENDDPVLAPNPWSRGEAGGYKIESIKVFNGPGACLFLTKARATSATTS